MYTHMDTWTLINYECKRGRCACRLCSASTEPANCYSREALRNPGALIQIEPHRIQITKKVYQSPYTEPYLAKAESGGGVSL